MTMTSNIIEEKGMIIQQKSIVFTISFTIASPRAFRIAFIKAFSMVYNKTFNLWNMELTYHKILRQKTKATRFLSIDLL